jgi:hypothetical protein
LGQIPTVPNWHAIADDLEVTPAPALAPVLSNEHGDNLDIRSLRERELLRSLVVGTGVLRVLGHQVEDAPQVDELPLTVDDYEQVRRLLQSPAVTSADEICDPLAKDMVDRANVFLQVRYGEPNAQDNPFNIDGAASLPGGGANRDLITRREIADLGNTRSRIVRQLVNFVRHRNDGYGQFERMGLVRRPPDREHWRNMETAAMVDYLRPWTAKQVRTHFDQLRQAHLITAERETANGPLRYALPEELQGRQHSFRHLPTADELVAREHPQ